MFWYEHVEARVKRVISEYVPDEGQATKMFNEMDDIISDVRWEATQDGRHEESISHMCQPD